MHADWPLTRDLVLIGGGHTHALVLRKWGMDPLTGTRLTLINPAATSPYTGMLPGHIAGHYARGDLEIDLVRLARFAGARIIFDAACGIDRQAKLVHLSARAPVRYDIASIDIGATADLPDVEGFAAHAHSVKPLGPFAGAWHAFLGKAASRDARAACIVIGGGVAGVELALAMAHRLAGAGHAGASVTLLEARSDILGDTGKQARKVLGRALSRYNVAVLKDARPARIHADRIDLADGRSLLADFIVSAAGARPYAWLGETGLAHTGGFINVGPDLRTLSDPDIFAAGDCAHLTHAPRPKAGVFAVREAPVLFDNLKAALSGHSLRPYHPQADYLKLVSAGAKTAVGQRHSMTLSGPRVWKVKDHIDTAFMKSLSDLPRATPPGGPLRRALGDGAADPGEPLCGGCGSKVGRASLAAGLSGRVRPLETNVLIGDDAAILQTGGRLQVISTDHLRAFVEDPYLLARIAAIHALGDIWAMGAIPQSALLSLIIPRMSEAMQAATVSETVSAVRGVLGEAGADLVGGHTSMGRELTIGLTVTGLLGGPATALSGARPGDLILLTKAIGTGVLLAGGMRGLARGDDLQEALSSMQRPLAAASRILAPVAHAMTDVTGFGLAGHLMNMLESSGLSARVLLAAVPVLPGAEGLAGAGVRSSLWRANASLDARITRPASALSDLVHDPQTAGGLLAAVSPDMLPGVLLAFEAAGEPAFVIGEINEGSPAITFSPP